MAARKKAKKKAKKKAPARKKVARKKAPKKAAARRRKPAREPDAPPVPPRPPATTQAEIQRARRARWEAQRRGDEDVPALHPQDTAPEQRPTAPPGHADISLEDAPPPVDPRLEIQRLALEARKKFIDQSDTLAGRVYDRVSAALQAEPVPSSLLVFVLDMAKASIIEQKRRQLMAPQHPPE